MISTEKYRFGTYLDTVLVEHCNDHKSAPLGARNGLEGLCNLATQVHNDLPGYTEHIEELIDAGDKIVVILSISGSHPVTGDEISFRDVTILTIKDGKIINQRGTGDLLTLYERLNMITLTSNTQ